MATRPEEAPAQAAHVPLWATTLPMAFVVLSLIALVLVPIFVGRRTRALWVEIANVAEPADFLVDRIQFALAREIAGVRGFLLTGEPGFLDLYAQAASEEAAAYQPLDEMAGRLGPDVVARLEQLQALTTQWHERADQLGRLEQPLGSAERVEAITFQQAYYREALDAAVALDGTIDRAVERRRAEIRAAERGELILTGALALIALAAVLVVSWLGWRLRRLTEHAEQRRLAVENLTQRRAALIRGLGHDLKNPLGAVDSYAQILEAGIKGDLPPEQRETIGRIRGATHAALNIINDLLELSRAEAGQLRIRPEPIELQTVVREAAEEYRHPLEQADLELQLELSAPLPAIESDANRIRQILGNLLSNAAKYVPADERVVVRTAVRSRPDMPRHRRWVVVDVEDTGRGIAPEEQEMIFDEFHRVQTTERETRGTGLGLAISRRIAWLLGGDLTVQSEVGAGSTFTLWLPMQPPASRRSS